MRACGSRSPAFSAVAACCFTCSSPTSCGRSETAGVLLTRFRTAKLRQHDTKALHMRTNKTKAKLAANQSAIGAGIAFPSPDLVELCGVVGFDFVTFDTEHEPMGSEQVVHCIRAAEAYDMTPIVRVSRNPDLILKFMNAGAQGIHVPRCNTAADLEA